MSFGSDRTPFMVEWYDIYVWRRIQSDVGSGLRPVLGGSEIHPLRAWCQNTGSSGPRMLAVFSARPLYCVRVLDTFLFLNNLGTFLTLIRFGVCTTMKICTVAVRTVYTYCCFGHCLRRQVQKDAVRPSDTSMHTYWTMNIAFIAQRCMKWTHDWVVTLFSVCRSSEITLTISMRLCTGWFFRY